MTYKTDEVMNSFASALSELDSQPIKKEALWHTSGLIDNSYLELDIGSKPMYLESVIMSTAAVNDEIKILKEKKSPQKSIDMIDAAHPDSVFIADALNEQSLVENNNEQHAIIVQMINKMPTGNAYAAAIIENLLKIASDLDEAGHSEQADLVDNTVLEVHASLNKKAILPAFMAALPAIFYGILGAGATAGVLAGGQKLFNVFTSLQEGLVEDTEDFVANLDGSIMGWASDSEYQSSRSDIDKLRQNAHFMKGSARQLLNLMGQVRSGSATPDQFAQLQTQFSNALDESESLVKMLQSLYPGKTKLDFTATLGHLKDIREGYNALGQATQAVSNRAKSLPNQGVGDSRQPDTTGPVEKQPSTVPDNVRLKEVQSFLNKNYYAGSTVKLPESGKLDQETQDALAEVATSITTKLGTNVPTVTQLESATQKQFRLLFELYRNPQTNPITGEALFPQNDAVV